MKLHGTQLVYKRNDPTSMRPGTQYPAALGPRLDFDLSEVIRWGKLAYVGDFVTRYVAQIGREPAIEVQVTVSHQADPKALTRVVRNQTYPTPLVRVEDGWGLFWAYDPYEPPGPILFDEPRPCCGDPQPHAPEGGAPTCRNCKRALCAACKLPSVAGYDGMCEKCWTEAML